MGVDGLGDDYSKCGIIQLQEHVGHLIPNFNKAGRDTGYISDTRHFVYTSFS